MSDKDLNAYIAAGVQSDHECSNIEEAMEKLRRGQYIMIREGTAAKNMEALMPLFREPYCSRCMLVTDDKHPGDLLDSGHIDYVLQAMNDCPSDIRNIRAYLLTALYNASLTIDNYYSARVNYDFHGKG